MRISVEKLHHQIRLRILSCGRMSENRRGPEVPEAEAPAVERPDGFARITSKELAPIHSVKCGTLQNACSTRPRVVVGLGESAHMHTVRLMNNLVKRSKKNDDQSAVAMLKKYDLHDRTWQPVVNRDENHDRTEQPVVKRDTRHELKHGPVGCRSSDTRQLGCVFQDMEPPKLSSAIVVTVVATDLTATRGGREATLLTCPSLSKWRCAGDVYTSMGTSTRFAMESSAVRPANRRTITRQWRPSVCGIDLETVPKLDHALVWHLNEKFFDGEAGCVASKILAAVAHECPGISKGVKEVTRAVQACRGWHRLNPAKSRLPLPL